MNYDGKSLRPGDEWEPAGLRNDKLIMYGQQVQPKYSKIVRRRRKKKQEGGETNASKEIRTGGPSADAV